MADDETAASQRLSLATRLIHAGRDPAACHGFVNTPVYRGSTVLFPDVATLASRNQAYTYGRRGNPTMSSLESAICELEGGAYTLLTSSGLQAVTTALLAFVEAGDEILMVDSVYQPTRKFCDTLLAKLGVTTRYYDPLAGAGIASLLTPRTRLVFLESPGSQTFEVQDVPAIVDVCRQRGIWTLIDNTWATPLYFQPLTRGVDVSIQSATKYLVGHADAMMGTVTGNERARRHLDRAKEALGTSPGSEEVFLTLRGLRTLGVRLERHQRSALALAHWLRAREEVERVLHPSLPDCPGHELWTRDFCGASGLFAVVLKPVPDAAVAAMLDGLALFGMGFSWGGYESLVIPFDPRPYRSATTWTAAGPALRFHIGLEEPADLIADLDAGFQRLRAAS